MTDQSRVWKVLVVLLASMTVGTIVLMSLGNTTPVSGAFSLSSYYKLTPPAQAISSRKPQQADRWEQIEITYSGTRMGDIKTLTILHGLDDTRKLNTHFVVCNGREGRKADGQIQTTERWQLQQAADPQRNWGLADKTICVTVIADGRSTPPTDCQFKRVGALVETLRHHFNIDSNHIHWPGELN